MRRFAFLFHNPYSVSALSGKIAASKTDLGDGYNPGLTFERGILGFSWNLLGYVGIHKKVQGCTENTYL